MKTCYYLFLFLLSGCSSAYIPSPKNLPLFEEKGEMQIEAGISTNSIFAAGSYALTDKYALIANGCLSLANFSKIYDFGSDWWPSPEFNIFPFPDGEFAHRSVEAGFGRFNRQPSSIWKREIFTGIGYGAAEEGKDWKNRYLQSFVQTNIGRRWKYFELGWSFRMAGSYFNYKYPVRVCTPGCSDEIRYKNFGVVHAEHITMIRFGGEYLKGFIRGGVNLAVPLSLSSDEYKIIWLSRGGFWNFSMYHVSVGLSYRFQI